MLPALVKHQIVDINIQDPSKAERSEFPMCSKFDFPSGKHIFPNSFINSQIRGNGISHSLYVKVEMWTAWFYINYVSYFQQWNSDKDINVPNSSIDSKLAFFECWS